METTNQETSSINVNVSPDTVYVSPDPSQSSYANLTFTFTNNGPAITLGGIAILLPETLYQAGTLSSITLIPDITGWWNFTFNSTGFQAVPAGNGTPVQLEAGASFTLGLNSVMLNNSVLSGTSADLTVVVIDSTGNRTTTNPSIGIQQASQTVVFSGTPPNISNGGASTLSWTCTGIDYCILSPVSTNQEPASGSLVVSPNSTTIYTLTAYSNGNGVIISAQFGISVGNATVNSFGAPNSQNTINYGENITLVWQCNQFTESVALSCDDSSLIIPSGLKVNDTVIVGPIDQKVNFQLIAQGNSPDDVNPKTFLLNVNPPSCTFTATPDTPTWPQSQITINWALSNVGSISIDPPLAGTSGPSMQMLNGSAVITPLQSITYTITYTGYADDSFQTFQSVLPITVLPLMLV